MPVPSSACINVQHWPPDDGRPNAANRERPHWETAIQHGPDLIRRVLDTGIPRDVLVNVNFPDCPPDEVKGIAVTSQGKRAQELLRIEARRDGRGNPYYWIAFERLRSPFRDGTDLSALADNRMEAFLTLTRPVLFFMRRSGGLVLLLFGARETRRGGAVHSPDELKLIVTASRQFGQIPESQEEMIHNAIELDNITVREVMVARPDIFSLPSDLTLDEALNRVVEGQHSRIPVYDPQRGPEHIVGVLYYKELVRWVRLRLINLGQPVASRIARTQIGQIMHDVLVVPETKVLAELLDEFKKRRRHLAVVVDEFGSTAGVITVEDILEQLVGDIEDEFDVSPPEPELKDESVLVLEGAVNIRDLETQHGLILPRDAGFETLAGFVLARLQRIPYLGESFDYEGHRYTVEDMEGHRIARVKIEKVESIEGKAEGAKHAGD